MKRMLKNSLCVCCALLLLITMLLPVSATPVGGGQASTVGIKAYGCDLSFWNVGGYTPDYTMIDFEKMKADGCEFVILRMGFEGTASRENALDTAFVTLYEKARAAGLGVGAYFYALATTYEGAAEDAQWCIDIFEQYNMYFEYPIYYDVEDPGNGADRPGHDVLTAEETTQLCLGWCETLSAAGYFPGTYGIYETIAKLLPAYTQYYDVWYAYVAYAEDTPEFIPEEQDWSSFCGMWQYSWEGDYDGVGSTGLDVNVAYKDYPSIMAANGYNNVPKNHTITFDTNGGSAVRAAVVADGKTLTVPSAPAKTGFAFGGWYSDEAMTTAYDFSSPVTQDMTLYAKWNEVDWDVNTDLMPKAASLTLNSYNDSGEGLVPTYNSDGSVTLRSGVSASWAWPSAYMSYMHCADTSATPYLYVKKDGTAHFNAVITYLTVDGAYESVTLAALAGETAGEFAEGEMEIVVNLAEYVSDKGQLSQSGKLKYVNVTYYVMGATDSYVTLYDMRFVAPVPEVLTSSVFTVDETIISGVKTGVSVSTLLDGIDQKDCVSVYAADGTAVSGEQLVASGMTVAIEHNGEMTRAYTLAVIGDVNGDGEATTIDARAILVSVVGGSVLNDWQQKAADYNGDSEVNTADVRELLRSIVS